MKTERYNFKQMNSEFYIGGKKFISSKRASKLTGYATDYIGQLVRSGKLDAQMIGRSWYVAEESLLGYKNQVIEETFSGEKQGRKRGRPRKSFVLSATAAGVPAPAKPTRSRRVIGKVARVAVLAGTSVSGREAVAKRRDLVVPKPAVTVTADKPAEHVLVTEVPAFKPKEIVAAPVRAMVPYAMQLPVYAKPDYVRAAGNFILSTAMGVSMIFAFTLAGPLYRSLERGAVSFGDSFDGSLLAVSEKLDKGPEYLSAGVERIGDSVKSAAGSETMLAAVESGARKLGFASNLKRSFDEFAVSFYRLVNASLGLSPKMFDVPSAMLASHEVTPSEPAPQMAPGVVVVPSTGDEDTDARMAEYIKSSFSDEVEVVSQSDDGTSGVVRPVFKNGKGDDYMYVLVPVREGG